MVFLRFFPPLRTSGQPSAAASHLANPIRRLLTGNDVVDVTDRESIDHDPALPRGVEALDPVGRVDHIHVKGPALELHENR